MRYIDIGGTTIPKHCKYGPRPAEGIVLNNLEWWSIADHLIKEEREREMTAVLKAKEETKKDISFQMTKNWNNTLASVKTQSEQKRIEKREREKQDKIDQYNEILKNRTEEKKKIVEDMKKILKQDTESVRTIKSAVLYSVVLQERQQQIDLKNALKQEEFRKDKELGERFRLEAEEFKKEVMAGKLKEKNKKKMQKEMLDKQMEDIKLRRKAIDEELAEQKQDLKNMRIEFDKIHHCNMVEKAYKKEFSAKYIKKTQNQIEHEQRLVLEEEEENEINKIYLNYTRKFQKERKIREEQALKEKIDQRTKTAEKLAEKLMESAAKETERLNEAEREKLEAEEEREKIKEMQKKKALAEVLEEKKKADEKMAIDRYEAKEELKWNVIQSYRTAEVNQEWRENLQKQIKEQKLRNREAYDEQCREKAEREAKDLKEWTELLGDDVQARKDESSYCSAALDFVRENKMSDKPVLAAIAKMRGDNNAAWRGNDTNRTAGETTTEKENSDMKAKNEFSGVGCYCLKC